MRENYTAWNQTPIVLAIFQKQTEREQLETLINFAVLAPSSHNSQPWAFQIIGNKIIVSAEIKRRLPVSDANDRQLYISLGCAITNMRLAGEYLGRKISIDYQFERLNNTAVAILTCEISSPNHSMEGQFKAILTRTNNRNPYEDRVLPEDFIRTIKRIVPPLIQLNIVTEKEEKKSLAEIAVRAGITAMESRGFRSELSNYVKPNLTRSPIGMPCFGMGIPTPISFIAPALLRHFNMNKVTAKKDLALLIKHTPALGIISSINNKPATWIAIGVFFEELALRAEQIGVRIGMWAAPVQIGTYYQEIQRILDIQTRPQAFFRMGYTDTIPPHSPRLSASAVIRQ